MIRPLVSLLPWVALCASATGAQTTYQFLTDASVVNHWPGPDGLIGTADDVVDGAAMSSGGAGPNTVGAFSQGSFDFGFVDDDPLLAPGYHAVTFVHSGSFVFDPDGGAASPLLISFDIVEGSEPFVGHGPYSAQSLGPTVGTSTISSFDLSEAPYTSSRTGFPDDIATLYFAGDYWIVDPNGAPTGDPYFDSVLTPVALANNAASYVVMNATGGTGKDGSSNYGDIPIQINLVGFEIVPEPSVLGLVLVGAGLVLRRRR